MSLKRLVIAGLTSGSIGVALSIIGTILSQLNDVLAETRMYEQMANYFESVTGMLISLIILMLLAGLLLAFLGTLIRYADFSIKRKNDELVISRGLFERKQMTIPLNRIQSVRLVEGILRQPFGLLSLQVDSAGYAGEEGTSTELFPLLKRSEVEPFIRDMLPEFDIKAETDMPPLRASRRFIIVLVVPALLGVAALTYFGITGYWILGMLPVVAGWGWLRYLDTAIGCSNEMAVMRYRRLSRTTVMVPRKRIQRITFDQNLLQKKGDVSDITLTVASGRTGASFQVQHMDQSVEDWLPTWLFNRLGPENRNFYEKQFRNRKVLPEFAVSDSVE